MYFSVVRHGHVMHGIFSCRWTKEDQMHHIRTQLNRSKGILGEPWMCCQQWNGEEYGITTHSLSFSLFWNLLWMLVVDELITSMMHVRQCGNASYCLRGRDGCIALRSCIDICDPPRIKTLFSAGRRDRFHRSWLPYGKWLSSWSNIIVWQVTLLATRAPRYILVIFLLPVLERETSLLVLAVMEECMVKLLSGGGGNIMYVY